MSILGVTPYLYYEDADAALTWLEDVLGFTDPVRWRDGSGVVTEADIFAGPAMVSISGGKRSEQFDALLIVNVDDVDAQYARVSQLVDGATAEPPVDQPYGPRTFTIRDPWGHAWTFWQGRATPPDIP